jgi:hypothetical protein
MPTNDELFAELIKASRVLVTVSKNAATVLSEEFEDMITGPAAAVEEILDKCPEGGIAWDGSFSEVDVEEGEWDTGHKGMYGLLLTHKPSQKAVQVSVPIGSQNEFDNAKRRGINALHNMVAKYVIRQREIGAM